MLDIDKVKYDYEMPFLNIIKGLKSEKASKNIYHTTWRNNWLSEVTKHMK